MSDALRRLHETWLGMVQPIEGLVLSPTVLADKGVGRPDEGPAQLQRRFLALCPPSAIEEGADVRPRIRDLPRFLDELLGLSPDLFDAGDALPAALRLDVPEADQRLRPSFALRKLEAAPPPEGTDVTEGARAGAAYEMLVWDLAGPEEPDPSAGLGLDLDAPEQVTGDWRYPPTAKLDRLLRHLRVPIGLLTNRDELRLIYAPHGESTGYLTFRLRELAEVGGRPMLDALVSLLSVQRFFGVDEDVSLPALLRESRLRQANVTTELAEQVFDALSVLLAGFQAAAERDPDGYGRVFADALEREDDHVYRGLLTVMLRLVFLLFAEDRALLPLEHSVYEQHLSVFALFARLEQEAGQHADSMAQRFGAWGQLLSVFRAVFTGVDHGPLHMPPRHGDLFDPHRYPFLEGVAAGASPLNAPELQAEVKVPTLDDGSVYAVLQGLVRFDGQRLSYKALDVEQIGSVYEALMGYHVERMSGPAVRMKGGAWISADDALARAPAQRAKWLKSEAGLSAAQAKKLAAELTALARREDVSAEQRAALGQGVLAGYSVAGRRRDRSRALAQAGQLVLQPGEERRRTSSHYTPRSLSAPIVERTLAPLVAAMGEAPTAEQLLELKVCDPAMGSGAFLVAACGYLGDELVAAWTREGRLEQIAEEAPQEDPVLYARRLVAQRCLYGVDKNAAAVELAKLSLWLFTLARDRPFTFLDHALKHGDSLVGLSFEQIRSFTWEPAETGQQISLARRELDEALAEAIPIRQRILSLALDPSPEAQLEKEELVRDAADALGRARLVGDVLLGAFFAAPKARARLQERERRWLLVQRWLGGDDDAGLELRALQEELRRRLPVFHWMLEFPEVFWSRRPDPLAAWQTDGEAYMDAVVGNPPFMGGSGISGAFGREYLDWIQTLHPGAHGNADLSAHFFLRAADLLGEHGTMGLIATNTIAQGDTRATGLQALVRDHGYVLYDATRSLKWPVPGAAVMVAIVHAARGTPAQHVELRLDSVRVDAMNSRLRPTPERPDPVKLPSNAGCSFKGAMIYGQGFTLTPEERDALIAKDARNAERIFPYLGGKEVNTSPTQSHSRYVISFGQMTLEEAEAWPDLIEIVREKVKPERDKLRDNPDGRRRKAYWWQFGRWTPALYEAIAPLDRCLAIPQQYTHGVRAAFQSTTRIFSQKLIVLPIDSFSAYAILHARAHDAWCELFCGRMGAANTYVYSPSDCFDTFPFPQPDPRTVLPDLEAIGQQLDQERATYMRQTDQGLTQTYNRLKDPDCQDAPILHLRQLHEQVDAAVLRAYADATHDPTWTQIEVPPYAPATTDPPDLEAHQAALSTFNDTLIDHLFVLNAERAKT